MLTTVKALGDSTRVRIVAALLERELCVCELCDSLGVTQSTLSTHLQVIRKAGLVSARKEGKWMYYEIRTDARAFLRGLFKSFRASLTADASLLRDAQRLRHRLSMRDNGACRVGFSAPIRDGRKRQC